ncbi:hypothetical protein [Micrococcus luteus]|uniref:hypothetical protein n=1 Tax=Micrococcus luteus TaxID=1270 RepID=UPI00391703CF
MTDQTPQTTTSPETTDAPAAGPEDTTTTPPPALADGDTEATAEGQDHEDRDEPESGNKEAIRYRRRLRETEAERDALATTVSALQRRIVLMAVSRKIKPEAFDAAGHDPAAFVSDNGDLALDELDEAIRDTAKRFGLQLHVPDPGQGARGPRSVSSADEWMAAFGRRR